MVVSTFHSIVLFPSLMWLPLASTNRTGPIIDQRGSSNGALCSKVHQGLDRSSGGDKAVHVITRNEAIRNEAKITFKRQKAATIGR
uniref:Putative secreted protein n=1 Tax=Anopheles darlingi TaxID=43151 RepID=A0A2M4DJ05_ANODA